MLGEFSSAHVEHLLAQVLRLVGHALEAARNGHQRVQGGRRELALPVEVPQFNVDGAAQSIPLFLGRHRPPRQIGVLLQEGPDCVSQHCDGQVAEFDEFDVRWGGVQRAHRQHLAGDALGVIANALQFLVDLDGREDEPQLAGDRLVAHQELQAQLIEFGFPLIEILIPQDYRIGQLPVPLRQGAQASSERALTQTRHLGDFVADEIHIPLQGLLKM